MTLQSVKQTNAIHLLPDISIRPGNKAMKFGQLIKYKVRNNSPEKSYTKWGGETSPRPFSKNSKLSVSLDQPSKFYRFFCMPKS